MLKTALAKPDVASLPGPVLLWQEDVVAQLPSLLFTVRRPLQQVYLVSSPDTLYQARRYADPEPLRNFVAPSPKLILMEKTLAADIPADMEFHAIAVGNTLEAGTIQLVAKNASDAQILLAAGRSFLRRESTKLFSRLRRPLEACSILRQKPTK